MSKHTPGPWRVDRDAGRSAMMCSDLRVVAPGSTWDRIRPIAVIGLQGQESLFNARLIAAAPEILEALEAYHHHFGPLSEDQFTNLDAIRCARLASAAIAKAKGEA